MENYIQFIREDIKEMLEEAYNISKSMKEQKDKLDDLLATINNSWNISVIDKIDVGEPESIRTYIDDLEKVISKPINFNVNGELLQNSHQVRIINYGNGYAIECMEHYINEQGFPVDKTVIQKSFDSLYDAKIAYINYMIKGFIRVINGKLYWVLS